VKINNLDTYYEQVEEGRTTNILVAPVKATQYPDGVFGLYSLVLKNLPEDGTAVPKHVEV
jgi:hypothetical protein